MAGESLALGVVAGLEAGAGAVGGRGGRESKGRMLRGEGERSQELLLYPTIWPEVEAESYNILSHYVKARPRGVQGWPVHGARGDAGGGVLRGLARTTERLVEKMYTRDSRVPAEHTQSITLH